MRIKMKVAMSGGEVYKPGDVLDKPKEIAEAWIREGIAEPLEKRNKKENSSLNA